MPNEQLDKLIEQNERMIEIEEERLELERAAIEKYENADGTQCLAQAIAQAIRMLSDEVEAQAEQSDDLGERGYDPDDPDVLERQSDGENSQQKNSDAQN